MVKMEQLSGFGTFLFYSCYWAHEMSEMSEKDSGEQIPLIKSL